MLKLSSPDPVRIRLADGAFAICDPISSVDYLRAQAAMRDVLLAGGDDIRATARFALISNLVHHGVRGLEGVADVDGSPIEGQPNEEQIDRLLAWFPAYESFEREYAGPILEAEAEKNGLSPSRGGSSTPRAAKATAEAASPTTGSGATNVPPSSTPPEA